MLPGVSRLCIVVLGLFSCQDCGLGCVVDILVMLMLFAVLVQFLYLLFNVFLFS